MKGIKPEKIPEYIKRDVELIKKEGAAVLRFNNGHLEPVNEFSMSELARNHKAKKQRRIDVLAIIGPIEKFVDFNRGIENIELPEEAVLLEIGLGREKPYHASLNTNKTENEPATFHKRRQWFQLSEDQFLTALPIIFDLLQKYADERTNNWKTKDMYLPMERNYWIHRKKTLYTTTVYKPIARGIRFAIAKKDKLLIKTIYWSELNLNEQLKNHLQGFAKFIDKRFLRYRKEGYARDFSKLKGAQQIIKQLNNKHLPKYLVQEMVENFLPKGAKNILYNEICQLLEINIDEKAIERSLASEAEIARNKINKVNLRVTTGLNTKKDHIVFELLPNAADTA